MLKILAPAQAPSDAKKGSWPDALCLGFSGGMSDESYQKEVGRRLRVTAKELGMSTAKDIAKFVGATRGAVDAWLNGRALPPVPYLRKFLKRGVTLDWIFYEESGGLPQSMEIRLTSAMQGAPPPDVKPEIEPAPEALPQQPKGAAPKVRRLQKGAVGEKASASGRGDKRTRSASG